MNNSITIKGRENGPLLIFGSVTYVDESGKEERKKGSVVALCRCGKSKHKPFCDGSHQQNNFQAPAVELKITVQG